MECDKCHTTIDVRKQSFVVCEGECRNSYHTDCVGVSETQVESLVVNNILWMCDGCLDRFYKCRSASQADRPLPNTSSRLESELAEIKLQIHDIVNTLSNTLKASPDATVQSSTPISSTLLLDGSGLHARLIVILKLMIVQ